MALDVPARRSSQNNNKEAFLCFLCSVRVGRNKGELNTPMDQNRNKQQEEFPTTGQEVSQHSKRAAATEQSVPTLFIYVYGIFGVNFCL